MGENRCTVAGHVCVDLVPELGGVPHMTPGALQEVGPLRMLGGGCVANTGADLAALGTPTRVVADVGADPLGAFLRSELAEAGCDVGRLGTRPDLQTSYSVVIEPPGCDRLFWHHVGSNAAFDGESLDDDGSVLLHLGYPSLLPRLLEDDGAPLRRLMVRLRRDGVTTSLDLATVDPGSPTGALDWTAILDQVLPHTDVLSASVDDLAVLGSRDRAPEVWARDLLDRGCAVVLVKAGDDGLALAAGPRARLNGAGRALRPLAPSWSGQEHVLPRLDVDVVSTRGAGDAATAGLLHAIGSGAGAGEAAETARLAATVRVATGGPLPHASQLRATADGFVRDASGRPRTGIDPDTRDHGDRHAVTS